MAQKIGINFNGEKELKLGKTFLKGFNEEAYHTIRYDFKPASVDSQKVGSMEVADKGVTLTVPLMGGSGMAQEAVFKGNKTPASKDCLLILDHTTGEIILERISEHIRVKKTRTEGGNRKVMRGPVVLDAKPNKPSPSQNNSSTSSPHRAKRSPPSRSPSHKINLSKPQAAAATPGSMPMLNFEDEHKNNSIMSDTSSDSDSATGSSSSSDSDSDSDTEASTQDLPQNYTTNGHVPRPNVVNNHKSPTSVLSDLELSEED